VTRWFLLIAPLVLVACAEREVILPGERLPLRADLTAADLPPPDNAPPPASRAEDRAILSAALARDDRPENRAVAISLPAQGANADWTHRGGDARHQQPHGALSARPQLVWAAPIGTGNSRRNRIEAAPVATGGAIFTMDALATVTATAANGGTLWSRDLTADFDRNGNLSGGGLALGGGRLFVVTGYGELVALNPADGAVLWRQRLEVAVTGSPATDGTGVFVAGRDGTAWAVEAATGQVRWTLAGAPSAAGKVGSAAPAVGDRAVFFPFTAGLVTAALKDGGTQIWQAPVAGRRLGRAYAAQGDITGDPVLSGDRLILGTSAGRTVAVSTSGGDLLWAAGEGAMGPPLLVGGSVFTVNDDGRLVRLDAATGEMIWAQPLPYFDTDNPRRQRAITANYGPVLAGGRIAVASGDGILRLFDPASGALAATAEIPGGAATQPILANGALYIVSQSGQLLAYR
jgi:outer membrane protein assembly factor BamB